MPLLFLLLSLLARAGDAPRPTSPHPTEGADAAAPDDALDGEPTDARDAFLGWQRAAAGRLRQAWPQGHPEPAYRFAAEVYGAVAPVVAERPGVVAPFLVGTTVKGRPIWAFRVKRPGTTPDYKVLVFAGIHALEWISTEVGTSFLEEMLAHPPDNVELVVIPILNLDGRMRVEHDFKKEPPRPYRRANANGVDLNRDFEVNRESDAVWKKIVPGFYEKSPAPLSQPESQALDRLAAAERFDVSVSLHAFGGYIYYPWSGLYSPPKDQVALHTLGRVMEHGQPTRPYQVKQLSHWGFFFRALGSELDHMYGKYGTLSYLIELSRSGVEPFDRSTWKDYFRWYNPRDPDRVRAQGVGALHAMVGYLGWEGLPSPQRSQ